MCATLLPMAEPRVHTTIRVGKVGHDMVTELAEELGADRSTVHRAALAVAFRHEAEFKMLIKEMK